MVSVDNGIFDDLPYADSVVSPEELARTQHLVEDELDEMRQTGTMQQGILHPGVTEELPLPVNTENSLLMKEMERYEEDPDADGVGRPLEGGVDLARYSDFGSDGELEYNSLYVTLSYAALYDRNLDLSIQNADQLKRLQDRYVKKLEQTKSQYAQGFDRKRKSIEDVNESRRKKQLVDFQPVNEYLNSRWKEGLKSLVDMGVEASRLEMDSI